MHGSCNKKTNDDRHDEHRKELSAALNLQGANEHIKKSGELRECRAQKKSE